MSSGPAAEIRAILAHYDLGELVDYERDTRGFVNTSYAIDTLRDEQVSRYFLRRYKKEIREEELQFEHALIDHLVARGFSCVARILKTRTGESYLHWQAGGPGAPGEFVAIFQFLPGEDRYTWVSPACDAAETAQAAVLLARYHSAVSDFEPRGRRSEPKILELLPAIAENVASSLGRSKHTAFDDVLAANAGRVLHSIETTRRSLERLECARLPQLVIHCDYHPGNLKFQEGEITGLFDFDWSKVDLRLFDLALATWYFCTSWEGEADGQLRLDQAGSFLGAYQAAMRRLPGVGPLREAELQALPDMIAASNLYILNWTVEDYYQKEVDEQEYLRYLQHSLRFVEWYEGETARQSLAQLSDRIDRFVAQE
jgi:homoserine kinase type II